MVLPVDARRPTRHPDGFERLPLDLPPALELEIRQLNHATPGIKPPAFRVVFNERNYGVAREAVFLRHSLHFMLPQSD